MWLCHFDAPVVTVSWFQERSLGPFIHHMCQTLGSGTLDPLIYNIVAQNDTGPDLD